MSEPPGCGGDCRLCPDCLTRLPVPLVELMARSKDTVPAVYETAVKCAGMWLRAHQPVGRAAGATNDTEDNTMSGRYTHSKIDRCSGVAAQERGRPATATDHQQCGDNDTENNAPGRPSPRITFGVRTDIDD